MKQLRGQWSRRSYIAAISGTGAMIILNPLWSIADGKEDPGVAAIVAQTIGIDTHIHMDVPFKAERF